MPRRRADFTGGAGTRQGSAEKGKSINHEGQFDLAPIAKGVNDAILQPLSTWLLVRKPGKRTGQCLSLSSNHRSYPLSPPPDPPSPPLTLIQYFIYTWGRETGCMAGVIAGSCPRLDGRGPARYRVSALQGPVRHGALGLEAHAQCGAWRTGNTDSLWQ